MPFVTSLTARLVMAALVAALMFLAGAYWQKGLSAKAYTKLATEYASFKGGVEAAGRAAVERNARQALADLKAKERTDAEFTRRLATARRSIERLRLDTDSRSSRTYTPPPDSKCPEGLTCFDTDAFERARRELFEEVRRLADEGTEVAEALRSAREWASGVAP